MRRRTVLVAAVGITVIRGRLESAFAEASDSERQKTGLTKIKSAVTKATGYADNDLVLTAKDNQLWLIITNSALNQASAREREAQATQIVDQISRALPTESAFEGTFGIHIDYVDSKATDGKSRIVDSIDFRKNPRGQFVHHTT